MLEYWYSLHDVIMSEIASPITGASIVYPTVCSTVDQRKHQSSAWLAFVRGIHRWPVNSPHKGPVMRKIFPFDDVIMFWVKYAQREITYLYNKHYFSTKAHIYAYIWENKIHLAKMITTQDRLPWIHVNIFWRHHAQSLDKVNFISYFNIRYRKDAHGS